MIPSFKVLLQLMVFGWGVLFFSCPGTASPQQSQATQVERQQKRLEKNIASLEKTLEEVKKTQAELCPTHSASQPFVKNHMNVLMQFLTTQAISIQTGGAIVGKKLLSFLEWQMPWDQWNFLAFKVLVACIVGIGFTLLALRGAQIPLRVFLKWSQRVWQKHPGIQTAINWLSEILARLIPLLVGAVLQISIFFLMEDKPILRNGILSLTAGFVIWGSVWQLQQLFLKYGKKTALLRYLSSDTQRVLIVRIQILLFFLIVGDWVGELAAILDLPQSAQKVLWMAFGLGITVSLFTLTQILKRPLLHVLSARKFSSFGVFAFLWMALWNTFPLILYALFIVNVDLFRWALFPTGVTLISLPLMPFLYNTMRLLYVRYLWRNRRLHPNTFWDRFLSLPSNRKRFFRGVLYVGVTVILFFVWDIQLFVWMRFLIGNKFYDKLIDIAVLFVMALGLISAGDRMLRHYLAADTKKDSIENAYLQGRLLTLLTVTRTFLRVAVWVPFLLLSLSMFYNVTLIITSLGVVSIGLTFGVQSFVKDFVTGFFILLDNSLVVGDLVEIDGKVGKVEDLTLRTLKIRSDNGTLLTIPFGNIAVIGNKSRHFAYTLINLAVTYDADPEKVHQILEKAYQVLKKSTVYRKKILAPIEVRGLIDVTDYTMVFQARLKTAPGEQEPVKRAYTLILKKLCDEAGLSVPRPPYSVVVREGSASLTNTQVMKV